MISRALLPLLVWALLQSEIVPSNGQNSQPINLALTRRPFCNKAVPSCTNQNTFRTADGTCNNLNNPLWGSSFIPSVRYLAPVYGPNNLPRGENSAGVSSLPTPRAISAAIKTIPPEPRDDGISLMVMQWGQFIDHDFTFTPEEESTTCCPDGSQGTYVQSPASSVCRMLDVRNDPFYSPLGIACLRFTRSVPADISCDPNQTREQTNTLTAYLDASMVYGSTQAQQNDLRTLVDGSLKVKTTSPTIEGVNNHPCFSVNHSLTFLPTRTTAPNDFFTGDGRVQEQPGLTSIHTLFVRVHNKIAAQLKAAYSSKTDNQIFQVTRKIVSALVQKITYGEFLPVLLGSPAMQYWNLTLLPQTASPSSTIYNANIDPSVPSVVSTAAFRFGHTLVKTIFELRNADVRLADNFNKQSTTLQVNQYPSDFLEAIGFNVAESMDHRLIGDLVDRLFAPNAQSPGSDLMARNIMRGRDHGIPPYMTWRQGCFFPTYTTWSALKSANIMNPDLVDKFSLLYSSVNDIDLFPAMIAEYPQSAGIAGPTLICLLGPFFNALKLGDRFWFENVGQFTQPQLQAIQKTTLAALICDNTKAEELPFEIMRLTSQIGNPATSCCTVMQGTVIQNLASLNFF